MLSAFQAILGPQAGGPVELLPGGGLFFTTGEAHPFANFAIGVLPHEIPEVAARLRATGMPAAVLDSEDRNPELEAALAGAGFSHAGSLPGMEVELAKVEKVSVPDGYRIERLSSGQDPHGWAHVLAEGYPVPPVAASAMSPVSIPVSDSPDAPIQFFQAIQGNEAVAVSALIVAEGLAGVYCVATLPDHRGRGLGAALTVAALQAGREIGLTTGVLQASEAGFGVYQRIGFVETGKGSIYV